MAAEVQAPAGSPVRSSPDADTPGGSPVASPRASALAEEVKGIKVILDDAASSQEAVLDALASLQAQTIPTKILGDTLIGKTVNALAKSSPVEAVRDAAGKLVTAWRETHRKRKASFGLDRNQSTASLDSQPTLSQTLSQDSLDLHAPAPAPEDKNKMTPQREKVRQKIIEAFGKVEKIEVKEGSADDGMDFKDPDSLATAIEIALNKDLNEKDYMSQARAVLYNLKDKKNPMFRFKLLVGAINADTVPKLKAADMASDEKNAERKKFQNDAMAAIDQDWAMKNGQIRISGLFTCGKCKGTQTTYFQMQTRSSDEPMTTFASCLQCGNRWKFC